MITILDKSLVNHDDFYWHIFMGQHNSQINLLLVRYNEEDSKFWTYEADMNNEFFKTFPIDIPSSDEKYIDLFKYDDKNTAELWAVYQIVKNFPIILGLEFDTFISRYKDLQQNYPELLLKV